MSSFTASIDVVGDRKASSKRKRPVLVQKPEYQVDFVSDEKIRLLVRKRLVIAKGTSRLAPLSPVKSRSQSHIAYQLESVCDDKIRLLVKRVCVATVSNTRKTRSPAWYTGTDPMPIGLQSYAGIKRIGPDSWYIAKFLDVKQADALFDELQQDVEFLPRSHEALQFRMYGRTLSLPRDKQFYATVYEDKTRPLYRYSAGPMPDLLPWTPTLETYRSQLSNVSNHDINHLVVNRYRNGNDFIGPHRDKSRDFSAKSSVYTISLGTPRMFDLTDNDGRRVDSFVLEPGSLFILGPLTNAGWKHSIRKASATQVTSPRISLTYRAIATRVPFEFAGAVDLKNKLDPVDAVSKGNGDGKTLDDSEAEFSIDAVTVAPPTVAFPTPCSNVSIKY